MSDLLVLAVDAEDISKIRNNHPLNMYPFIRTRMEIVPMKQLRKYGINVYVHKWGRLCPQSNMSLFSGAADDSRGLSGGGLIDLMCQLLF